MKSPAQIRRILIKSLLGLPLLSIIPVKVSAAIQTPRATEGPFYPLDEMRHEDIDNNLVKISGGVKNAGGEVIKLSGRVLDTNGKPIKGARVEIWQCDVNGHYLHTSDTNQVPVDKAFQGFGHSITDNDGMYSFRTIKPVPYPGRTPHIHVKAFANGRELTTQFYLNDYPLNSGDFLYRRLSRTEQQAVGMTLRQGKNDLETSVDIII
jgi:protocatechuate 3,4-dioxygenase beta subunit